MDACIRGPNVGAIRLGTGTDSGQVVASGLLSRKSLQLLELGLFLQSRLPGSNRLENWLQDERLVLITGRLLCHHAFEQPKDGSWMLLDMVITGPYQPMQSQ